MFNFAVAAKQKMHRRRNISLSFEI